MKRKERFIRRFAVVPKVFFFKRCKVEFLQEFDL